MKKLLFLALLPLAFALPAKADPAGCQVYAAQPAGTFFSAGDTPVIPCDRTGAPWVNTVGSGSNVTVTNGAGAAAVNIQDGGNSITVDGTVGVSGNVTVVQPTAANLNATIGNGAGAAAVNIQDGGNSITVDGTVSIGAGSAVIGHVITDSGSTTVVTGTVAVTQSGTWSGLRVVGNAGVAFDAAVVAGTAPTNMIVGGALYNSTEISPTTGQSFALQADSKGRLRNVIMDGAGNTRAANVDANSNLGVVLPAETTKVLGTVRVQGNIGAAFDQATGSAVPANALYMGISDAGTMRGVLQAANSLNSTGTGIPTAQAVAQCDDTSPTALSENQFGNARLDCATHAQLVTAVPSATAGGTTLFTVTLAASTNATNVKASAGQVYSISGFNISSATPVFISLYNNSGTPTCGTSIIQQFMIPGSTTGAGFVYDFATPKGFATGIAFCATTGIAGTGNPAATTYVLNIDYK